MPATEEPPMKKMRGDLPTDDASLALLDKVYDVQKELDEVHNKAAEEIVQVEIKFNKLRTPMYEKRAKAIAQIPDFWVTTMLNHPIIAESLAEHDTEILTNLTSIDVVENEDIKSGFSMEFKFKKNPYFKNESITKKVTMNEEGDNILSEISHSIRTVRRTKDMKEICAPEADEGFVSWLQSEVDPEMDDIGNLIKDDLFPTPMEYYNAQIDSDEEDEEECE
ncbi:unnamed protein product [Oikopleura dioica]|uniref:Uncharacterized protein n=1 Tax=Oikopleura dioica TaxID=34765 RepID=E4YEA3_OIKDI|nr:unnamed protein product [Oikopleura dioica]